MVKTSPDLAQIQKLYFEQFNRLKPSERKTLKTQIIIKLDNSPEAKFKQFEPRLKFEIRLKYGWFHLKLYSMFQDLCRSFFETGF